MFKEIFDDCVRIGNFKAAFEATRFSGRIVKTKRLAECMKSRSSVEQLIEDNA